jgi:hypothetical protein
MEDLYLKENPFNIPNVGSNVESSIKDAGVDNFEASVKASKADEVQEFSTVPSSIAKEKGNSTETL